MNEKVKIITKFGEDGKKYIKKPIPIEAKQILHKFIVQTKEGTMRGKAGDYLIKGIKGELYPCDKQIFWESYDHYNENGDEVKKL